ncbi:hypothetical protein I317_07131 [Kwoniella heveanensis CBS 569]|nr:hypothetical protein I317_07131 [Kwoniella heveanensis CBS 569]
MSFRSAVSLRRLATSAAQARAAIGPSAPVSAPEAGLGGFSTIRDLLATPSSSSSSSSQTPAAAFPPGSTSPSQIPSDKSTIRGYSPTSLPPTVDPTLDLLTNCLMKDGKKSEAQKMVSSILSLLHQATNLPPQPLVRQAILLSSPSIKILSMRKSAKTVLAPRGLTERQRSRQGVAWLLKAAEKGRKGGVSRDQRIAREVLAVLEGNSDVFKWLEERHKIAYLNRSNMTAR